jgi:hypothetical protein
VKPHQQGAEALGGQKEQEHPGEHPEPTTSVDAARAIDATIA